MNAEEGKPKQPYWLTNTILIIAGPYTAHTLSTIDLLKSKGFNVDDRAVDCKLTADQASRIVHLFDLITHGDADLDKLKEFLLGTTARIIRIRDFEVGGMVRLFELVHTGDFALTKLHVGANPFPAFTVPCELDNSNTMERFDPDFVKMLRDSGRYE